MGRSHGGAARPTASSYPPTPVSPSGNFRPTLTSSGRWSVSSAVSDLLMGSERNGRGQWPGLARPSGITGASRGRRGWGVRGGWRQQGEAQGPSGLSRVAGTPIIANHL